jgi:hypothetical protein
MNGDAIKLEKIKIHFLYCAILSGLIIILIASDRWTGSKDFTQYLTNSATMTSLVLALVAIFYSFVANDGLSKSMGNISTVANDVKDSKDQIADFLAQTTSSNEVARNNAKIIEAVSAEVSSTLSALGSTLSAIKTQTDSLNSTVSTLPPRLDVLETNLIDATRLSGEKVLNVQAVSTALRDEDILRFNRSAALIVNLVSYACVLSQQTNKPLVLGEFTKAAESKLEDFLAGGLGVMAAIGIITFTYTNEPNSYRTYHVSFVHPKLADSIKGYFLEFIKLQYKDKNKPETFADWTRKFDQVEALFK